MPRMTNIATPAPVPAAIPVAAEATPEAAIPTTAVSTATMPATLPASIQRYISNPTPLPNVVERPVAPYVTNAHPAQSNWGALQSVGIKQGEWSINYSGHDIKLDPFRYWLFTASAFATRMNTAGDITSAVADDRFITNQDWLKANKYQEHYVTALIVDVNGKLIPAKADFRYTKAGAATSIINAVKAAADPAWLQNGDAHMATAVMPHPFGRVMATCICTARTSKSGDNKGMLYHAASANIYPAPLSDIKRVIDAMNNVEFLNTFEQVIAAYNARVEQIKAVVGK